MRQFVRRSAAEHGLDSAETFQAQIVATEAVTNAMRHAEREDGAGAPISVACHWQEDGLTIEVGDRGRFRPPKPPESLAVSGRGLAMIERLTDRFELETGDDGTRLRMLVGQAA